MLIHLIDQVRLKDLFIQYSGTLLHKNPGIAQSNLMSLCIDFVC